MGSKFNGSSHQSTNHKKTSVLAREKIIYGLLIVFGFFFIVGGFWFTRNVLQDLPDVSSIKDMVFSQATVIADRN